LGRKLVNNRHVKLFQTLTDSVRESLGRPIDVYVGSGTAVAGGSGWDPVNEEPLDPNEPLVYDDTIFSIEKAIVRWVGENAEYEFLSGGRVAPGDVFLKCRLEDVLLSGTDMNNDTIFHHARKVIIDGQTCKVAETPRKTGLRDLYSVEVWCKRVDME
jgi:hypothetical protein